MMNPIAIPMEDPIMHHAGNNYCCFPVTHDWTCPCMNEGDLSHDDIDQVEAYRREYEQSLAQERNATTECSDGSWW